MAFSDLLTENNLSNLLNSRGRIIVDRWKGMNKDQLDNIRCQQLRQIDERQVSTCQYVVVFFSKYLFLDL